MFSKVNGGLEQVFLNYIPTLKQRGHEVISVIHPAAQIRSSCPKEGLVTLHNFNQHDWLAIWRLRRLIQQEQPDCIIMHSYRAAYLLKKTGTKVPKIAVCHVKGHYDFGADALIAITENMRQEIIASGKSAERVFTVPNMIELSQHTHFSQRKRGEIPLIGAIARFAHNKGIDIFIAALVELKRRNIAFRAQIAGDGPEKEKYLALVEQHHLIEQVEFLGWLEDREHFYSHLDIFCLPSREEAFGLVILESMKHHLPMVLSDLSGPREIIGHTHSALLVEPENPIKLANGLQRLIEDKVLSNDLALQASQRVKQYSYEKIGEQLERVLLEVSH